LCFIACDSDKLLEEENYSRILDLELKDHYVLQLDRRAFTAYHEGWVYTNEYDVNWNPSVHRMHPEGTGKRRIGNLPFSSSIYKDGWIYCMEPANTISVGWDVTFFPGSLFKMRLDGSEQMKFANMDNIVNFTLFDDWIYYLLINGSWENKNLYRMRTNGSDNLLIAENCFQFIIADEYIFKTERISANDTKIIRNNLDGTASEVIAEGNNQFFTPIFTDNGYLYFSVSLQNSASGVQQIHRIKFDGTGHQTITQMAGVHTIDSIVLNNDFIYYTCISRVVDSVADYVAQIFKIAIDGTDSQKILELTQPGVFRSIIFGDYIYYSHYGNIYRLNKNGGLPEIVYNSIYWGSSNNPRFVSGWFMSNNKYYIVEEPLTYNQ
jgi:hypothetical protein